MEGLMVDTPSTTAASTPVDKDGNTPFLPPNPSFSPKMIQDLDIANDPSQLHEQQQQQQQTVTEPVSNEKALPLCPTTPLSPTFISTAVYLETTVTNFNPDGSPIVPKIDRKHFLTPLKPHPLPQRASAASDLSSAGTLPASPNSPLFGTHLGGSGGVGAVEPSATASSASSIHSKTSSSDDTVMVRQQTSTSLHSGSASCNSSLIRQKFLADKEARKATLRLGASETIQARAESLQSPTLSFHLPPSAGYTGAGQGGYGAYYEARASIDSLRVSPTRLDTDKKKPPVKSLISFWEQVSDPNEL